MEASVVQPKQPWQLQMFRRSLKKQQKLKALQSVMGPVASKECLLITCGDNNGALNWHFKQGGGRWSWADAERDSVAQIQELTGDPVTLMDKHNPSLPFSDGYFDVVITNDVHEHVEDPEAVNRELARLVKPGGTVIVTTPRGDERKLAARLKHRVGMGLAEYGHVVAGYDIPFHERQLKAVGLKPYTHTSYSFFFTELVELMINFLYVKVLSKRSKAKVQTGQITPQNKDQLKSVEKSFRIYALFYPIFWIISQFDHLVRFTGGYAVVVAARKE